MNQISPQYTIRVFNVLTQILIFSLALGKQKLAGIQWNKRKKSFSVKNEEVIRDSK